jgi:NitT/TauT family transport system ATP-binding protein
MRAGSSSSERRRRVSSIVIDDLGHEFLSPSTEPINALDGVNLAIDKGEFVALLGPSGCGKSTLLYLVGGFIPVQRGSIRVNGKQVAGPGPDRGIVFQSFALFPWKTALGNILYGMERLGIAKAERERRAHELIRLVNLTGFEGHYPWQLSGGMQQRVALARTLAIDPDILLMDEPFGALDAQTRRVLQNELRAIWMRSHKTVLFVTHDVHEAVYLAQRVAVMSQRPGRIAQIFDTRFDGIKDANVLRSAAFIDMTERAWDAVTTQMPGPGA